MSRLSNKNRLAKFEEIEPKIQREIEELDKKLSEASEKSFQFRQKAIEYKERGNQPRGLQSLRMSRQYEQIANNYTTHILTLMGHLEKLETIHHKLFLRSFPDNLKRGIVNTKPDVNPNNNSLERFYSRRYSRTNAPEAAETTNENSNVESHGCLRDAFGRCIEGIKARLTRSQKSKSEGGGKRNGRKTRKQKSKRT